jgi:hypothetical protein
MIRAGHLDEHAARLPPRWSPKTRSQGAAVKIAYDRTVDALYIRFKETTATTKHLAEGIAAD